MPNKHWQGFDPILVRRVHTVQLASLTINEQKHHVEAWMARGALLPKEAQVLFHELEHEQFFIYEQFGDIYEYSSLSASTITSSTSSSHRRAAT